MLLNHQWHNLGTPTQIVPSIPGDGLSWDLSEFNSNGKLKVVVATGLDDNQMSYKIYPIHLRTNFRSAWDNS